MLKLGWPLRLALGTLALQFWPGAMVMVCVATLTASLVTNSGRSAWFVGVRVLMVYPIFAMKLYLLRLRYRHRRLPCAICLLYGLRSSQSCQSTAWDAR